MTSVPVILEPCPFCGEGAQPIVYAVPYDHRYPEGRWRAHCSNGFLEGGPCSAEGPMAPTREGAAALWNARASTGDLVEALERLTGLLEAIREDSISTHFKFGATEAERKNRIQQLIGFIEANASKVDDALEDARAALAKVRS